MRGVSATGRILAVFTLVLLMFGSVEAFDSKALIGDWKGRFSNSQVEGAVEITFNEVTDSTAKGTILVGVEQSDFNATIKALEPLTFTFSRQSRGVTIQFELQLVSEKRIEGTSRGRTTSSVWLERRR